MNSSQPLYLSEQWTTASDPDLAVTTRGAVPPADVTRAVRAIGRVLRRHHLDVPARVRVTAPEDHDQPTVVQANIRMHDVPTRVQVTGPRGFAVTFAVERLDRQITRLASNESRCWPDPARPPLARITDPRPITRRKECALLTGTPEEATSVMDAMDYDSYLFTDAESGEDALVCWADPVGVVLARQRASFAPAAPAERPLTASALPVSVRPDPTPTLTEAEAATWLCRAGLPFLFFTDERTGRGTLLYRRYDGDLTVVVPA
ncbi:sigma 54 modulation/S30EA ribosomal C-terminal domain-containing protein [Nocardia takedensis]|uniref:sigma 54 modulation/S30EA ribosomal C-terminal domain-containing protein n=1 Tax=Nocardia takedensis TaxID=259390 RepID=UPI000685FE7E|nr:sigma 54 modulation/S30EA ribosomal C-terminal domain-containing protein [Nocardia takedensis]